MKSGKDLELLRLADDLARGDDFASVLVRASLDGLIGYDLETRYTIWSPSMERLSGFRAEEVMGRHAFDVFPFMREIGLEELYLATFRGESSRSGIFPFRVPETGAEGYFEQQNFPLFDECRRVVGGIAVVRDLTAMMGLFQSMTQGVHELEARERELLEILGRVRREADEDRLAPTLSRRRDGA